MSKRTIPVLERTLEHSSQLAVRWTIVLIFALAWLAYRLGLDLLLGGFAAGMITRQLLRDYELAAFESKLTAVAFRRLRPLLLHRERHEPRRGGAVRQPRGRGQDLPVFVLFLVVRGTPALLLYRNVLNRGERRALALLSSTQLPLVVAITALATSSGHMRSSTAAALVGAALLSTLVFPMLGLRIAKRAHEPAAHEDASLVASAADAAG